MAEWTWFIIISNIMSLYQILQYVTNNEMEPNDEIINLV